MEDINIRRVDVCKSNLGVDGSKVKKKESSSPPELIPKDVCTIGKHKVDFDRPSASLQVRRAKVLAEAKEKGMTIPAAKTEAPKFITIDENGTLGTIVEKEKGMDSALKSNIVGYMEFMMGGEKVNETPANTDINQTQFVKNLLTNLGSLVRIQNEQDISKLNGRIPTIAELNDEFKKLAKDKSIPYEYIIDGCYARAHLMCETMMKDKINCAKMFVIVEDLFGEGQLTASNKFMNASWWYHVAPLVFAKDTETGEVKGFIMDPSIDKKPLTPEEWINRIWDKNIKIKIDITRVPQYGPIESDGENVTFEENLPQAREVAKEYSEVLKKIKEEYYANHPDEHPQEEAVT